MAVGDTDLDELGASQGTSENEIARLKEAIRRLEADNDRLAQMVKLLQPQPVDDTYPLDQFMVALAAQRGCTYGWRKDYADATHNTPGCLLVSTEDIQRWQREKKVPARAYAQIGSLTYPKRRSEAKPTWKAEEDGFLITLCRINPQEQNAALARRCTEEFGRLIDQDAIKGKKYRLVRAGRLPECDPSRH